MRKLARIEGKNTLNERLIRLVLIDGGGFKIKQAI
jgi:hypothetical protein